MSTFHLLLSLHNLAALVWVGGMFFAWMVLRPAAVASLEPAPRLQLWAAVFPRFFRWVWLAIATLVISGGLMLKFGGMHLERMPAHVQLMIGLFLVMLSLFLRIQTLLLPALRKAVDAQNWGDGAQQLGKIRRMVGCNLIVGLVLIGMVVARLPS